MSNTTQELLEMITALRQRLDNAQDDGPDANVVRLQGAMPDRQGTNRLENLRQKLTQGRRDQELLRTCLRQTARDCYRDEEPELPDHLTGRALNLLKQSRDLLAELRLIADEPFLGRDDNDPIVLYYQDTVLLAELIVRTIQTLPENPGSQLRVASSVDVLLGTVKQRTRALKQVQIEHSKEENQIEELSLLLQKVRRGGIADWNDFFIMAEAIAAEADEGTALRFCSPCENDVLRAVAAHCLSTARVAARVAKHDLDWKSCLLQPVVAALVHDVGMLAVPRSIFFQPQELNDEQRVVVEKHCRLGARWIANVQPVHPWLTKAARSHHERPDGLGYPDGLNANETDPIARLISACDAYAALCSSRTYRQALDPVAALSETIRLGQKSIIDANAVSLLRRLSYCPAGTAVQLNDGACGIVISAHSAAGSDADAHRHVIRLLTDCKGDSLPYPTYLDLGDTDQKAISRALDPAERRKHFGDWYPQWA